MRQLLISILSALTLSFCILIGSISYSVLIYTGPLEYYFTIGIVLFLGGAAIYLLGTALLSTLPIAIANPQSEPLPIIILITTGIIATTTHDEMFSTILVAFGVTTLFTGLFLYILGRFRLGNLVRYVPFPVIVGFLASIGWLLMVNSIKQIIPSDITFSSISTLFMFPLLIKWALPVLFAFLTLIFTMRYKHSYILPLMLFLGMAIFYLTILIMHVPISYLRENNYLINLHDQFLPANVIHTLSIYKIDWLTIANHSWHIMLIAAMTSFTMLFFQNGLELETSTEIDFNHELKINGMINLFSGLFGGPIGYTGFTYTMLNRDLGNKNRLVGVLCGLIFIIIILFFKNIAGYIPRIILIGFLLYLGINIFKKWIYSIRSRIHITDYIIIFSILSVVIFAGLFDGVIAGIIVSIILFTINYSRISPIKYELTGKEIHSNYRRDIETETILKQHGDSILYIKLHNFLFFGTANLLNEHIHEKFHSNKNIKYIIYDFKMVDGIDFSLITNFEKINRFAKKHSLIVIITEMQSSIYKKFSQALSTQFMNGSILYFSNHQKSLAWCEEAILKSIQHVPQEVIPLIEQLNLLLPEMKNDVPLIAEYFTTVYLKSGEYLLRENSYSMDLYYLESGQLSIYAINAVNQEPSRIAILGPGSIIGEMAFYIDKLRSASIIAEKDCKLKELQHEQFKKMQQVNPKIATVFDRIIIKMLTEKIAYTNQQLALLMAV